MLCIFSFFSFFLRYKAIKKSTEEVFAVKVTSVSNLIDIRNELVLQKICNCEHVMRVYDCFNWEGNLWVRLHPVMMMIRS